MPGEMAIAGAALGGIGAIGKIFTGFHQNSLASKIHPEYHAYETSPFAQQQLGLASQLFNGRMSGAADEEKGILASGANYNATVQRNATDSGQALSLAGLSQGTTNSALKKLQIEEGKNKYDLLGNLNAGYSAMVAEGDKKYQDQLQKFQFDTQQKAGLRQSGFGNIFGGIADLSSLGIQSGQMGGGGQSQPYTQSNIFTK